MPKTYCYIMRLIACALNAPGDLLTHERKLLERQLDAEAEELAISNGVRAALALPRIQADTQEEVVRSAIAAAVTILDAAFPETITVNDPPDGYWLRLPGGGHWVAGQAYADGSEWKLPITFARPETGQNVAVEGHVCLEIAFEP